LLVVVEETVPVAVAAVVVRSQNTTLPSIYTVEKLLVKTIWLN